MGHNEIAVFGYRLDGPVDVPDNEAVVFLTVNAVSRELAGFGEWPDNDDPDGVWARVDDEIKFESGDGWQVVGCR